MAEKNSLGRPAPAQRDVPNHQETTHPSSRSDGAALEWVVRVAPHLMSDELLPRLPSEETHPEHESCNRAPSIPSCRDLGSRRAAAQWGRMSERAHPTGMLAGRPIAWLALASLAVGCATGKRSGVEKPTPAAESAAPVRATSPRSRLEALLIELTEKALPGASHEYLKDLIGSWDLLVESRSGPEAPWMQSTGTSVCVEALGGRYVIDKWSTTLHGQPFEVMHVLGYDRLAQQFTSIWMDSFSTWPALSSGPSSAPAQGLRMEGRMRDVLDPQGRPIGVRVLFDGLDKHTLEMLEVNDAGEYAVLRVHATRKKGSP